MTGPVPDNEIEKEGHPAFGKKAFCRQTGFDPARVHVMPFLLPHLRGGGEPKSTETGNAKLRCLFVGREDIRKGLPRALQIFNETSDWSLHVISSFSDGIVNLPSRVTHQHSSSRQEVLGWMSRSDLLFSLSEFDSFGFAAVEAASRQCIPVFRVDSIQETMFSSSAAVFLHDSWTPQECIAAIEKKVNAERELTRKALSSEFRTNFSPESVLKQSTRLARSP